MTIAYKDVSILRFAGSSVYSARYGPWRENHRGRAGRVLPSSSVTSRLPRITQAYTEAISADGACKCKIGLVLLQIFSTMFLGSASTLPTSLTTSEICCVVMASSSVMLRVCLSERQSGRSSRLHGKCRSIFRV